MHNFRAIRREVKEFRSEYLKVKLKSSRLSSLKWGENEKEEKTTQNIKSD